MRKAFTTVVVAIVAMMNLANTTYILTFTQSADGWNYGNVLDPSYGMS